MAIAASTYCNNWAFEGLDPLDPLRSIARAETQLFINRPDEVKVRVMTGLMNEYRAGWWLTIPPFRRPFRSCWDPPFTWCRMPNSREPMAPLASPPSSPLANLI